MLRSLTSRLAGGALFATCTAALVVACGSRTGLLVPDLEQAADASDATTDRDARPDREAAPTDGPLFEGGPIDVVTDCGKPAYCDPADLSKIYQCGVAVYQCSSLEQCESSGEEGARCVNPCVDTLGQDTSNGCEFYAVEMDLTPEVAGGCFAVFVVNQWGSGEPAKLEVTRGGQTLDIASFARIPSGKGTGITYEAFDAKHGLDKDQVAILFLSRDPAADSDPVPTNPRRLAACPPGIKPAVVGDAAIHGTGRGGQAFRLKSNVPVVAYQVLPYGAGRARVTGATLLLPTNVWDNNYVLANAWPKPTLFGGERVGPTLAVVAKEDKTSVTIRPTRAIVGTATFPGTPADVPVTYTLNRGEYLQVTQDEELTGSALEASSPVAVLGGSTLMDVPLDRVRADGAEQMLPPVRALANEYVAVRYRSRDRNAEESVPWRIVGVVDGTQLSYEPAAPPGAPATVRAREVVQFDAPGPLVVRSQDAAHPFYFAQYMTGGQPYDGEGDPEYVNVISPRQYLPRYTFFTDPTYPETNLVVVRVKDALANAFPDVELTGQCSVKLGGWAPVGTGGRYEFTRFDLSTGNFQGQNGCDNGVHTIVASFPSGPAGAKPLVGVTVWGWGNPITYPPTDDEANPRFTRWVSYGYPAGANLTKLNSVVLPAR